MTAVTPDSAPHADRLAYLDNLRVALIVLVVAHHAGQAYGPGGWWYFDNPERASWLSTLFILNRSYFMSLFFMISGYFLPSAFDRKGAARFLKDRGLRLGVPLVCFFLAVIPTMLYVYYLNFRGYGPRPFWDYYLNVYFGAGGMPAGWSGPTWPDMQFGHLWFVEHLLVLAIAYAAWRLVRGGAPAPGAAPRLPTHASILLFALALALTTFAVRIEYPIDRWVGLLGFIQTMLADVPRDLSFFVLGVIAYRRDWFRRLPATLGGTWLAIGVAAAALYIGLALAGVGLFAGGGLNSRSLLFALWESLYCCGMCVGLLVLFRERVSITGRLGRFLSANVYAVYLFHVPVVVLLQYALGTGAPSASLKWGLVTLAGVPLTFVVAGLIRRLSGARSIL